MGKVEATCYPNAVSISRSRRFIKSDFALYSVINTFKSMVVEDGILDKEDMYILNRMKEFISRDEVSRFAAAKHLMIQIERAVCL
jgi:son of sevenless-like protein